MVVIYKSTVIIIDLTKVVTPYFLDFFNVNMGFDQCLLRSKSVFLSRLRVFMSAVCWDIYVYVMAL